MERGSQAESDTVLQPAEYYFIILSRSCVEQRAL
jgi:hypothetical protein